MVDNLIISFAVFSVLGYFAEVIYCSIPERRFVNRGFLYGPYLPIYGFGSLIVTIILDPVSQYPILVFLLSFLLTSVLEYFTSWLLEKLFSVKLWDYSKKRININGRVCLLNSTLFGLLGLFAEYAVQPLLQRGIEAVPPLLRHYAATILLVDEDESIQERTCPYPRDQGRGGGEDPCASGRRKDGDRRGAQSAA